MASKKKADKVVEETTTELTREQLEACATDLNDSLGIDPVIELDLEDDDLKARIIEEAKLIGVNPKTDKFDPKVFAEDQKALAPETFEVLAALGATDHLKTEEKPAGKKEKEAPAKKEKSAGGTKKGPIQGPGIIAKITEIIKAATKKKPVTKADILSQLEAAFPERDAKAMKSTIQVQVPSRLAKEKKLDIQGDSTTGYYVA